MTFVIVIAILAVGVGAFSAGLISTFYLNYVYVLPFIHSLENDNKLKENHQLYKIVLTNSYATFLTGLVVIFISYFLGGSLFQKYLNIILPLFIIWFFISTYIFQKRGNDKEKIRTISNFQDPISAKLKDVSDFGKYLYGVETNHFEDTSRIFAEEVDRLSTDTAYNKGLTGEAHKAEARRLFMLAVSLTLDPKNPEHTEAIQIRQQAQIKTPSL